MPALRRNLTIEQGTTWAHGFGVTINGTAIDDTWTVKGQIRADLAAPVLFEWSTAAGTAGITDGAVTLTVEPVESTAWVWRSGYYDVEVTSPDGDVYRVASGRVRVDPEITQ